jgi:hypothetical protein
MPLVESSLVALQAGNEIDDLQARVRQWMDDSDGKCKRTFGPCFNIAKKSWNDYDDLACLEHNFLHSDWSEWLPKRKSEYDSFESRI